MFTVLLKLNQQPAASTRIFLARLLSIDIMHLFILILILGLRRVVYTREFTHLTATCFQNIQISQEKEKS